MFIICYLICFEQHLHGHKNKNTVKLQTKQKADGQETLPINLDDIKAELYEVDKMIEMERHGKMKKEHSDVKVGQLRATAGGGTGIKRD